MEVGLASVSPRSPSGLALRGPLPRRDCSHVMIYFVVYSAPWPALAGLEVGLQQRCPLPLGLLSCRFVLLGVSHRFFVCFALPPSPLSFRAHPPPRRHSSSSSSFTGPHRGSLCMRGRCPHQRLPGRVCRPPHVCPVAYPPRGGGACLPHGQTRLRDAPSGPLGAVPAVQLAHLRHLPVLCRSPGVRPAQRPVHPVSLQAGGPGVLPVPGEGNGERNQWPTPLHATPLARTHAISWDPTIFFLFAFKGGVYFLLSFPGVTAHTCFPVGSKACWQLVNG